MKKFFIYFSISIFLTMGFYTIKVAAELPSTYNAENTKVYELQRMPDNYAIETANGSSEIQVKINLEATGANNVVNAIIYEFRSFDSLIIIVLMLTTIIIITSLFQKEDREEHENEEKYEI